MTVANGWLSRFTPRTMTGRRAVAGYIFISPFILGFLLWFLIPAGTAAWLAFHEWNLISPPKMVGFANFQKLWTDELLWQSL